MTTQPVTLAPNTQMGETGDNQKFQAGLSYTGPCE